MVAEGRRIEGRLDLDELIDALGLLTVPFDQIQLGFAVDAFRRYGKGRRPAALNLDDCCSYALSRALDQPLLLKGNDFALTDIESAPEG